MKEFLKVLYSGFDTSHLYDPSGHTKHRYKGLNANMTTVAPGGVVRSMRSTIVSELGI